MNLAEQLLQVSTSAPARSPRKPVETEVFEVKGDELKAVIPAKDGKEPEAWQDYLKRNGEDPDMWDVAQYRTSTWTLPNGEEGVSHRYVFKRIIEAPGESVEALIEWEAALPPVKQPETVTWDDTAAFILSWGDMQFGKSPDSDPNTTIQYMRACLAQFATTLQATGVQRAHVVWAGDHIEGFQSQGGANVWRTKLTLTEQIRLTRRIMAATVRILAPLTDELTMVAVPGNHGEAVRFMGKGVTRYDDSHDTEALIAVAETFEGREGYEHVKFYTPSTDTLHVTLDVAGLRVLHVHGHQYNPGKHFEWLQGHSLGAEAIGRDVDLVISGHLHHLFVDTRNGVTWLGVPALEVGSQWFENRTGIYGTPGAVCIQVGTHPDGKGYVQGFQMLDAKKEV